MAKQKGQSGYDFEELLRAYFLRAGYYVLRGLPLKFEGDDATDVDLWLYEKPTGASRRRLAVDAKFKARPKASERIFWTRGLASALGLDGAFVATTDKRTSLRVMAKSVDVSLIDGNDLIRIQNSPRVKFDDRMTEEALFASIRAVDTSRSNRDLLDSFQDLKSSVASNFSASLVNIALDSFSFFSRNAATSHRDSDAARVTGRLSFLAASVAAIALDYIGTEDPFRTAAERRDTFVNVIRYGRPTKSEGTETLRVANALVRKYAQNGSAVSAQIEASYNVDFDAIPAEIIADQGVRMGDVSLFAIAKSLEHKAYHIDVPTFDALSLAEKSFLGALLDFSDVKRVDFAAAWASSPSNQQPSSSSSTNKSGKSLFDS